MVNMKNPSRTRDLHEKLLLGWITSHSVGNWYYSDISAVAAKKDMGGKLGKNGRKTVSTGLKVNTQ